MTRDIVSTTQANSVYAHEELFRRIRVLKKEMNALILAHYYTVPEIQQIADVVGDSLALARAAEKMMQMSLFLQGFILWLKLLKFLIQGNRS